MSELPVRNREMLEIEDSRDRKSLLQLAFMQLFQSHRALNEDKYVFKRP